MSIFVIEALFHAVLESQTRPQVVWEAEGNLYILGKLGFVSRPIQNAIELKMRVDATACAGSRGCSAPCKVNMKPTCSGVQCAVDLVTSTTLRSIFIEFRAINLAEALCPKRALVLMVLSESHNN